MNIDILTLFPEMVSGFFTNSIMARAVKAGIVSYNIVDWRQYAEDKHHKCDDSPFGGGAGMVIKPEPLFKALDRIDAMNKRVVYASPSGKRLTQDYARQLSREPELVFICGHYEGIDQRIIDRYVDDEICIGDYVISSGEVATLVIIDAVYRLIDGVITDSSLDEESFTGPLLEYPQYTRPETYCGMSVPDILLSGHHANIEKWRLQKRLEKTLSNRPDLLADASLDEETAKLLKKIQLTKGLENGLD
ncbi:MAG: tRNA (guanosine(37)-N1)-methyltransferase TrmD [Spirochaetales bacterium]|nr:tRNA (guanosine(37)-N1)-methyltransferase TrmD [Spirochaetales bacterium]